MSALRISGLHVEREKKPVLHGIDLDVDAGEIVALLGANGAGKSTLLATTAGLLAARSGTVTHDGRVATVLQSPSLARRSALRNVELALAWSGAPRSQRRSRAEAALRAMNAAELASRPARSLSGGQQRRIHLARAVAVSPDVLLLDEPFDGLDPATHVRLRDDAARALRESGGAVLVVLHDRRDAWAMADRIAVLVDGRLEAAGRPQALLDAPPTAAVARFLGYDGELRNDGTVLLTRAAKVHVDPAGEVSGRIERVTPVEDGAVLTVVTGRGTLRATSDRSDLAAGADVRVSVEQGVEFPG